MTFSLCHSDLVRLVTLFLNAELERKGGGPIFISSGVEAGELGIPKAAFSVAMHQLEGLEGLDGRGPLEVRRHSGSTWRVARRAAGGL